MGGTRRSKRPIMTDKKKYREKTEKLRRLEQLVERRLSINPNVTAEEIAKLAKDQGLGRFIKSSAISAMLQKKKKFKTH